MNHTPQGVNFLALIEHCRFGVSQNASSVDMLTGTVAVVVSRDAVVFVVLLFCCFVLFVFHC